MKVILIYNTKSGNTQVLAEKMKEILEKNGHECEIYRDKQIKKKLNIIEKFDLLCLGSCVHIGGPAFSFRGFLKKISKLNLKEKKLICFATAGDPQYLESTYNFIKKKLPQLENIGNFGCVERENKNALEDFENAVANFA